MKKLTSILLLLVCLQLIYQASTNKFDLLNLKSSKLEKLVQEQSNNLLINSKKHVFSNRQNPDTFKIILKGTTIQESEATFTIVNFKGKEIYRETFPASYLIGHELLIENPTKEQEENVIKQRVKEFFNEKNFKSPAISTKEEFEEDYSDKNIWQNIKADRAAVGFYYLVGEEDMRWIAYSKKKGKVVLYYNCC